RARKLFGRFSSFNFVNVPEATSSAHRRSYSSWEPSHQTTRSGLVSRAISETHWRRPLWRTHAGALDWSGAEAGAFIVMAPKRQTAQRNAEPENLRRFNRWMILAPLEANLRLPGSFKVEIVL